MRLNRPFLLFFSCIALAGSFHAQIKIFSGGKTIIGSTSTPLFGATLQVAGATFFSTATGTVTPTSAAYIRSTSAFSASTAPDYTWYGNDRTGFFHPAADIIGITINNSEKFRFNTSGQILNGNATSAVGTPDYSWNSDPNTGMYRPGADILGFVANGSEKMRINSSGQILNSNSSSSASTPDFSWNSNANTGFFRPASNVIGFATNGTEKMRLISTGSLLINTTTQGAAGDEKLRVVAASGDYMAARFDVTHTTDYKQSVLTVTNRALSTNYVVNYGGTDNFYVAGAGWIYSQGNYLGSDITIKDNVNTIDSAMSKINRIRGVTYKLKKETQNPSLYPVANKYMGVIAQEIEAVAPEAVKTIHDGTKAVSYEMLVGLLIQGMKEQSAQITQLRTDLNTCCTKKTIGAGSRTTNAETSGNQLQNQDTQSWLAQNKPNPFNKETQIEYNVTDQGKGSILIFDMNGKLLKTIPVKIPGKGSVTINASDFIAGMYYYSLVVNDVEVDTKKMILTE